MVSVHYQLTDHPELKRTTHPSIMGGPLGDPGFCFFHNTTTYLMLLGIHTWHRCTLSFSMRLSTDDQPSRKFFSTAQQACIKFLHVQHAIISALPGTDSTDFPKLLLISCSAICSFDGSLKQREQVAALIVGDTSASGTSDVASSSAVWIWSIKISSSPVSDTG